jgi:hypothetical protein
MTPNDVEEGNDDDLNVITVTKLLNMAQSLDHFAVTKKVVLYRLWDSSETLQEFTNKSLLKQD